MYVIFQQGATKKTPNKTSKLLSVNQSLKETYLSKGESDGQYGRIFNKTLDRKGRIASYKYQGMSLFY